MFFKVISSNSSQTQTYGQTRIRVKSNALAVARARADVFDLAAFIMCACAQLEKAMAAPATPIRFVFEVAHSRLAK